MYKKYLFFLNQIHPYKGLDWVQALHISKTKEITMRCNPQSTIPELVIFCICCSKLSLFLNFSYIVNVAMTISVNRMQVRVSNTIELDSCLV